eukprot:symbB.v1.2.003994.t1/scaffold208.1/size268109/1
MCFVIMVVASGGGCLFFSYNFNTGNLHDICGHGAGDFDDLIRAILAFTVFVFNVCQICSLRSQLDSAGRVLELACKCVLSTPSLILMPLLLSVQRTILLVWWLVVAANYFTSDLVLGEQFVKYSGGGSGQWEFMVTSSLQNKLLVAMLSFGLLWFNEVVTAAATFVMYFTGQVWQLLNNSKKQQVRCRTVRGYCIMIRYHGGSVIVAGLLQLFFFPFHITLGFFEDASGSGPIGFILESFCSCVLDFYRNNIGPFKRDALQGVTLHSMAYFEAAYHYNKRHNALEDVRVLNTQTKIFQIGGLGLAAFLGYLAAAQRLRSSPYVSPDEEEYVHEPFAYCMIGLGFAVWVALPFVKIFDVISDAVLYSMFTEKLSRPPPEELLETFRNCSWSTTVQSLAHCHCGMNRDGLPVARPAQRPPGASGASASGSNGSFATRPLTMATP